MGKKSRRKRSTPTPNSTPSKRANPPAIVPPVEETLENLKFEDPFHDEFLSEDEDGNVKEEEASEPEMTATVPWTPWTSSDRKLEMDPSAYKMHHALRADWPCMSFDFLRDSKGESRERFPHEMLCACGTQADSPEKNSLLLMKISGMCRTRHDDDSEEESDDEEGDPVLEHYRVPHRGGVNRVRASRWRGKQVVAVWGDAPARVSLYDLTPFCDRFERGGTGFLDAAGTKPLFAHDCQVEGYALDWKEDGLASGDCAGNVWVWEPTGDSFAVSLLASSTSSCEDLQWSPTESTVLATAEADGLLKIYDTRAPGKHQLSHRVSTADVNALSWNSSVANLLAAGDDEGSFTAWDLRSFGSDPLARFAPHNKPINSVEWHPTDESMVLVSDDDATYVYDLSVEEDEVKDDIKNHPQYHGLPPQMLFMDCGGQMTKESHWHPQVKSMIMTTALTGLTAFVPSNL